MHLPVYPAPPPRVYLLLAEAVASHGRGSFRAGTLPGRWSNRWSNRRDEERFGLEYDLDVYNIVAVSDFNMGGPPPAPRIAALCLPVLISTCTAMKLSMCVSMSVSVSVSVSVSMSICVSVSVCVSVPAAGVSVSVRLFVCSSVCPKDGLGTVTAVCDLGFAAAAGSRDVVGLCPVVSARHSPHAASGHAAAGSTAAAWSY